MQEILHSFKQYYRPQKNIVFERHQFWSHTIADGFQWIHLLQSYVKNQKAVSLDKVKII